MKDGVIRIFISQPMNGKTIEEIKEERERIVKAVLSRCCAECEVIDNIIHDDAPEDVNGVWHLGKSIQQMYDADVVIFSRDYPTARGCLIEHDVAMKYNMTVCYELTDDVYSIGYGYEWS